MTLLSLSPYPLLLFTLQSFCRFNAFSVQERRYEMPTTHFMQQNNHSNNHKENLQPCCHRCAALSPHPTTALNKQTNKTSHNAFAFVSSQLASVVSLARSVNSITTQSMETWLISTTAQPISGYSSHCLLTQQSAPCHATETMSHHGEQHSACRG